MKNSSWIFIKSAFIILFSLSRPNVPPLYACTATPEGKDPPTVADRVRAADLVFIGTVTMVTEGYEPSATVQVAQYFKGTKTDQAYQVEVKGFGGSEICRRHVDVGDTFIFYVLQRTDGTLYAHWLTADDAVALPSDALIAEITTALGWSSDMDIAHPPPTQITYTYDRTPVSSQSNKVNKMINEPHHNEDNTQCKYD
ncbi:MAG: hypothetical protein GY805_10700 [Chloroflexi bacterium]|nr:hypothetical protein [Chloroflexota bacterium]